MKIIIEDDKTKTYAEILAERNKKLFENLQEDFDVLYCEFIANKSARSPKPLKLGGRFTQCIFTEFAKLPTMSREDYVNLDCEDLTALYSSCMDFLKKYNVFEIPLTRQILCGYMGITVSKFIDLLEHNDPDVKEKALMINDCINGTIFANAEASNNNATATLQRSYIKTAGQGNTRADNDVNLNVIPHESPELQMQKALEIAKSIKALGGKK